MSDVSGRPAAQVHGEIAAGKDVLAAHRDSLDAARDSSSQRRPTAANPMGDIIRADTAGIGEDAADIDIAPADRDRADHRAVACVGSLDTTAQWPPVRPVPPRDAAGPHFACPRKKAAGENIAATGGDRAREELKAVDRARRSQPGPTGPVPPRDVVDNQILRLLKMAAEIRVR